MAWVVGIDEAGYGPNLGPFVMSLAALRVPGGPAAGDLWQLLRGVVGRAKGAAPGQLIVDDSKAVYAPAAGLARLEQHLLPWVWAGADPLHLDAYWGRVCLSPPAALAAEPWHAEGPPLPLHGVTADLAAAQARLDAGLAAAGAGRGRLASVVVFPRQFNALTAAADSKAAVPTWALMQLLAHLPPCAGEPLTVVVDRLGGRSRHAGLLQECFPAALVRVLGETSRESRYRVDTGAGPCDIAFVVGGDQRCLCTALASMASKYLREVLMGRFNAFWQRQLPGLAPTAGYPGDAARFWAAIAPARARLGIPDETLWRAR